jgi:hypothetical protein
MSRRAVVATAAAVAATALIVVGVWFAPRGSTSNPSVLRTSTPTPVASASIPATPDVDSEIRTEVQLYGQLVCNELAARPEADINELVGKFIAVYGDPSYGEEQQLGVAHRLLLGSTEKHCPDQTARVTAAFAPQ